MEKQIGVRIPDWLLEKVEKAAKENYLKKSDIVRLALIEYLKDEES